MAQDHVAEVAPDKKNNFYHVICKTDGWALGFGLSRMLESSQTTKMAGQTTNVLFPDYRGLVRDVKLSFLK